MGGIGFRVRVWLRRNRRSLLLASVVVGLMGGLAMGLVAGTRRTSSAPDRYTERAGGDPDLSITQAAGPPLLDEIRRLDGVRSAKGFAFVLAFPMSPKDGSPLVDLNPFAGNDDVIGARVIEGRFTDPDAGDEFTISETLARTWKRQFGTKVGDRFTFAGYSFQQLRSDLDFTKEAPEVAPFTVRLVGVTESPSDFDESSAQLILSKGMLRDHSDIGVVQTLLAAYLDRGTTPRETIDRFRKLPNGADAYASPLRIVSDSARRAVRFQSVALWLVSAMVIVAACAIAGLVSGRALRVAAAERAAVQALGWTRRDLAVERAAEGAVVGLLATPLAIGLAWVGSALFPLGAFEKLEPELGLRADWLVFVLGGVALVGLGALVGAVIGVRTRLARVERPKAAPLRGGSVPLGLGVHFATVTRRGNRAWSSAVVGAIGVAGIVGAAVAGTSITSIVDHGDRWGISYDYLYGNPYAPADRDIVGPILRLPHVEAVTGATIGSVNVNGADVATFAYATARGDLRPTVIEGRDPVGAREIGLGAEVMRRLHVRLGDMVTVAGSGGKLRRLEVVGAVVTPNSAGNGAALPFESFEALNPGSTQNVVMVDMEDGAPKSAVDAVSAAVYSPPDSLEMPTTIRALERVSAAPYLLCAVFGIMLFVGGAYLMGSSVRGRRRDFASVRSMGAVPPQRRAIVHWQATAIATVMMAVGVPVGILIGWRIVRSIVTSLGIVPGVDLPSWLVVSAVVVPLVVGNLVAILPAARAASARHLLPRS